MIATLVTAALGPLLLGLLAYRRRWLTLDGAIAAVPVGAAVVTAGTRFTLMLLAFFFSGTLATKYAARKAKELHAAPVSVRIKLPPVDTDAKTGRNTLQVLATGGIPAIISLMSWWPRREVAYLAYLACCCGDTLASELGQLSHQRPLLILNFMPAARGRDGAVTLYGTVASLLGGVLVGLCGGTRQTLWQGALYGALGSALDSVLGAVLQHPDRIWFQHWKLWNIAVNALSSILTVVLAVAAQHWPWLEPVLFFAVALVFVRVAELPLHIDRACVELLAAGFIFAGTGFSAGVWAGPGFAAYPTTEQAATAAEFAVEHPLEAEAEAARRSAAHSPVMATAVAVLLLLQTRLGFASYSAAAATLLATLFTSDLLHLPPHYQPTLSLPCVLAPALVARPLATMLQEGMRRAQRMHHVRVANRSGNDHVVFDTTRDRLARWGLPRLLFAALLLALPVGGLAACPWTLSPKGIAAVCALSLCDGLITSKLAGISLVVLGLALDLV